jgi:hypothetical protein
MVGNVQHNRRIVSIGISFQPFFFLDGFTRNIQGKRIRSICIAEAGDLQRLEGGTLSTDGHLIKAREGIAMNFLRRLAGFGGLMHRVKVNLLDKGGVIHQFGGEPVHWLL